MQSQAEESAASWNCNQIVHKRGLHRTVCLNLFSAIVVGQFNLVIWTFCYTCNTLCSSLYSVQPVYHTVQPGSNFKLQRFSSPKILLRPSLRRSFKREESNCVRGDKNWILLDQFTAKLFFRSQHRAHQRCPLLGTVIHSMLCLQLLFGSFALVNWMCAWWKQFQIRIHCSWLYWDVQSESATQGRLYPIESTR